MINAHFIPTVRQRPMVELMRGTRTSDETVERMRAFALGIDLVPLIAQKESTGFIFNRVWRAVKKESLHLVDRGVASHEDVDCAWMIFFGGAVGPFGLMVFVGLDVVRDIELVCYGESGDRRDLPPGLLLDKIARGEPGRKTGKGFYERLTGARGAAPRRFARGVLSSCRLLARGAPQVDRGIVRERTLVRWARRSRSAGSSGEDLRQAAEHLVGDQATRERRRDSGFSLEVG